jgi:hypothetical protein
MQRRKGAVGERELAGELQRLFGVAARRGQQYSGLEGEDVVGLHDQIHCECKRTERLRLQAAVTQAVKDAGPDKDPIIFHRQNHGDWLAIVLLDDLPRIAALLSGLKATGEPFDGLDAEKGGE